MQKKKCTMQRQVEFDVCVEPFEVTGIQGLDPKENFQPFI